MWSVSRGASALKRELLVLGSRNYDDVMNLGPELSREKIMREGILMLPPKNGCIISFTRVMK